MKTKFILIVLLITCVAPILVSNFLYIHRENFHFSFNHNGVLINPPFAAAELLGKNFVFHHKWQLVYAVSHCNEQIYKMQFQLLQLRKALGKNASRVELQMLTKTNCNLQPQFEFQKVTNNTMKEMDRIYLIDPRENVFMYYSTQANLMLVFKDLKKVLEVSQIG